jgi:Ca2+-binding RTX toxin-like protein
MMGLTKRAGLVATTAVVVGLVAVPRIAQAAPRCFGKKATIEGTGQNDKLKGTPHRDVIVGLGGHDRINGRGGDDLICGGGGRDLIRGKSGDDQASGGGKRDVLLGHDGNDRLTGGGGAEILVGAGGSDQLFGGPGGEAVMAGGPDDDLIDGGPGLFDAAWFDRSPVGVVVDLNLVTPQNTNEGIDTLLGVEGVFGSAFNDVLTGQNTPSETGNGLFGLAGTDQITALDGNDVIDGGPGNDKGGPGVGFLNGGLGADIIIGESGDDDLFGEAGADLLDGFEDEETTGDFGSAGPDIDQCFGIETLDMTPGNECEMNVPRDALPRLGRWRAARSLGAAWR